MNSGFPSAGLYPASCADRGEPILKGVLSFPESQGAYNGQEEVSTRDDGNP